MTTARLEWEGLEGIQGHCVLQRWEQILGLCPV